MGTDVVHHLLFRRLGQYHEDVAALRRYLVGAGLMTRSGGEYRRAG